MTSKFPTRPPLDQFPYDQHPESRPFGPNIAAGNYVFIQDETGVVYVVPETEGHLHPRVLGGARPAAAAGGLRVDESDTVIEMDNFSGTFQFGPEILAQVREALIRQGGRIAVNAEKAFTY